MDGYTLAFDEEFGGSDLDPAHWIPAHLPQWSSRAQAAARYELRNGHLVLQIAEDQQPWCPEFDGATKVSSLQTGVLSGPEGSGIGQHRFNQRAVVREAQSPRRLYTPRYGFFEVRARAIADARNMVAFWMIGYEDTPDRSGEICICEIFGADVDAEQVVVGMGIHPFGDPELVDDFHRTPIRVDATEPHTYGAEWTPAGVRFFVDGYLEKVTEQSPSYPMQLMLGIYEFDGTDSAAEHREPAPYPKEFVVEYVRGYRPVGDDGAGEQGGEPETVDAPGPPAR